MKCIQKLTHLKGVPDLSILSVLLTSVMTTIHSHITHINSFYANIYQTIIHALLSLLTEHATMWNKQFIIVNVTYTGIIHLNVLEHHIPRHYRVIIQALTSCFPIFFSFFLSAETVRTHPGIGKASDMAMEAATKKNGCVLHWKDMVEGKRKNKTED